MQKFYKATHPQHEAISSALSDMVIGHPGLSSACLQCSLAVHFQPWWHHTNKQTWLTAVSFLLHEQLTATHTCYMEATRTHYTHTHAHAGLRSPWSFALLFSHPGTSFLQDPLGAVGSFSAPGDQVNRPSRSRTDRRMLCFFIVKFWNSCELQVLVIGLWCTSEICCCALKLWQQK